MLTIHNTATNTELPSPGCSELRAETPDLESSSDAYAARFAGPVGSYFLDVQQTLVRQMLPSTTRSVLDVGGGHAQLAAPLIADGLNVTVFGSDDSCRPRLDRLVGRNRYRLLTGNLLEIPVADNTYDVVLGFRLLPHLDQWQRFLGELCRIARHAVILDYPDLCSVNWFSQHLFAMKKGIEKDTRAYQCFWRKQIQSELRRHQFGTCTHRGQFLFPMACHRMMQQAELSKLMEGIGRTIGLTRLFGSPVIVKASSDHSISRPANQ